MKHTMAAIPDACDGAKMTHYRWVVCALLFFATTVNYVDRQVFAVLGPSLTDEFHWTETDFSFIVRAFTLAYAIGYLAVGWIMDRIGVRRGFVLAVSVWSAAAMAHGFVWPLVYSWTPWLSATLGGTLLGSLTPTFTSVAGFSIARFALGLAEGGNFPGSIKTVGEWYPKKERAFSTGLFNSGSNVGMIVATYAVPTIVAMQWGWPAAFYLTGSLGFLWLLFWLLMYRSPDQHPKISAAELAYIRSDPADPPEHISWISLLGYRQTWAFTVGHVSGHADLVVLHVLDAKVFEKQSRHRPATSVLAAVGGVFARRCGQHRRRRTFLVAD